MQCLLGIPRRWCQAVHHSRPAMLYWGSSAYKCPKGEGQSEEMHHTIHALVQAATPRGVPVTAHLRETSAAAAVGLGVKAFEHASGIDYLRATREELHALAQIVTSKSGKPPDTSRLRTVGVAVL
jgi:imidazolonepropionase-like amidohydrolase